MKNFYTGMLVLMLSLFAIATARAAEGGDGHITTERSWDFTKGKDHASLILDDKEYWTSSSKGRFQLLKTLEDKELPSSTGEVLPGLEGIYLTTSTQTLYGVTNNYCVQANTIDFRIPGCGVNDEITIVYSTSDSKGEATVTSESITSNVSTSSTSKVTETVRVKTAGDVVLRLNCSKGGRMYSISVKPFVQKERHFTDFSIDFTKDPYVVTLPADGVLPEGVTVEGTWHDSQHGYNSPTLTVPVDGAVKISMGKCQYGTTIATIKNGDEVLATVDCGGSCNGSVSWVYNSDEEVVLTIVCASWCPSLSVEACDRLPDVDVSYFNTDGKLIGKETVGGGSLLTYKYGIDDVSVPAGKAFRGWFASSSVDALKVAEGSPLQTDTQLFAHVTDIEVPTSTSRFIYDLTKPSFYVEDHEAIEIDGKYYNVHGWLVNKEGTIKVNVAGKCYITIGCCEYSAESTAVVTDPAGEKVFEFPVKAGADGAEQTFQYDGEAGWLTITFPEGAYVHGVSVENVVDFIEFDETSGYYIIPAGDVTSFLIALKDAASKDGAKIFLPDGTYDLGTTVLTPVNGKNISIIGESMKGTVILNYPPIEMEGIGNTATLLNRSDNLYIQDLTLRNAMPFTGATGRAVCLQDKGSNTICKNVSLESYQDTYYSNNANAYFYFEDGEIHGVVDYVCGGGDVYFNRVKFVNESIKDATIAAPNGGKKFGYVMNGCTIETLCNKFNLGRSWGTYSGLAWLNTTVNHPSKLVDSRFNIGGMNCAADKFVEYNTMDASGKVISPSSKVTKFTHATGDKEYETILTDDEAKEYALDKVFPDWSPAGIAAQSEYKEGEDTEGNVYLVDGKIYAGSLPTGDLKVRKANARGGFGPEVEVSLTGIAKVAADAEVVNTVYYNLLGQPVDASYQGVSIKVETLSDGKKVASKIFN